MSAVVMLAVPADVYLTGTMHAWMILAVALGITVASYVYLPIFHQLGIVSVNQVFDCSSFTLRVTLRIRPNDFIR